MKEVEKRIRASIKKISNIGKFKKLYYAFMVECDIKKEIWRIAPHDGLYS